MFSGDKWRLLFKIDAGCEIVIYGFRVVFGLWDNLVTRNEQFLVIHLEKKNNVLQRVGTQGSGS